MGICDTGSHCCYRYGDIYYIEEYNNLIKEYSNLLYLSFLVHVSGLYKWTIYYNKWFF